MLPNDSGCGSMVVGASTPSDQHDSVKFSFLDCKLVCTLNSGGHLLGVWIWWWTWLCRCLRVYHLPDGVILYYSCGHFCLWS